MASKKASEIVTIYTLFKPFDGLVWTAIGIMICVQAIFLVVIRKILSYITSPGKFGNNYFQGMESLFLWWPSILIFYPTSLDIALPLALLMQDSRPEYWFRKQLFSARIVAIGQWLVFLMFLSHGYKCILLSTLVPIQYSKVKLILIRVEDNDPYHNFRQ